MFKSGNFITLIDILYICEYLDVKIIAESHYFIHFVQYFLSIPENKNSLFDFLKLNEIKFYDHNFVSQIEKLFVSDNFFTNTNSI